MSDLKEREREREKFRSREEREREREREREIEIFEKIQNRVRPQIIYRKHSLIDRGGIELLSRTKA